MEILFFFFFPENVKTNKTVEVPSWFPNATLPWEQFVLVLQGRDHFHIDLRSVLRSRGTSPWEPGHTVQAGDGKISARDRYPAELESNEKFDTLIYSYDTYSIGPHLWPTTNGHEADPGRWGSHQYSFLWSWWKNSANQEATHPCCSWCVLERGVCKRTELSERFMHALGSVFPLYLVVAQVGSWWSPYTYCPNCSPRQYSFVKNKLTAQDSFEMHCY